MNNTHCQQLWAICAISACLLLSIGAAHCADIAHKIRQGGDVSLELGLQATVAEIPLVGWLTDDPEDPASTTFGIGLILDGRAEWKGLFAETNYNSFSALALGYTPWSNDTTSVDLLISDGLGEYDPGIGAFESVEKRDSDLIAGVRVTHHLANTLIQVEAYGDISARHEGQMLALQVGKFRQFRNWNLHGLIGARYFSSNMLDYYFGISEEESTADIPLYEASGGTLAALEIGGTLPLSEKWIFKSTAQALHLPDSISDSPLANGRLGLIVSTSVSYVF